MTRWFESTTRSLVCALLVLSGADVTAQVSYYGSLDIGSDTEVSDPNQDGDEQWDPGDVLAFDSQGAWLQKDDQLIFQTDPPPPPAVPVGQGQIDDYNTYFDLDGEDQLGVRIETNGEPIPMTASEVDGLYYEPALAHISFDDDGAEGWLFGNGNVPVSVVPTHGKTTSQDEILTGGVWRTWAPLGGVADENALGLAPNPDTTEADDDDVDALDVDLARYWYFSSDHEASRGLDPGAIHVLDMTVPFAPAMAISRAHLGILAGTDVDAFEFCTTDDQDILSMFPGTSPGTEYLAIVFSVDENDPNTPGDESGGLNPNTLYLSLMTGAEPMALVSYDQDVDALAFSEQQEEPDPGEKPCTKWSQPIDCEHGIDMPSYRLEIEQGNPETRFLVADDWLCDGRPITQIRWWGSYPGFWDELEPNTPPSDPTVRPVGFRLTWYTDIPAEQSGTGYSMPGGVLTNVFAPLAAWGATSIPIGTVQETYACTVMGKETPPGFEDEFQYELVLTEPWNEKAGRIYWLSVEAVFPPGYVPEDGPLPLAAPEWGWKTSALTNLIDDAVVWRANLNPGVPIWEELAWPFYPYPMLFVPPPMTHVNYDPFVLQEEETRPSVNMAFELLTDVCPRRTTKWSQMPDMETGEDLWSWRLETEPVGSPYLRADDFISDGRLISDIHWWGSYSNWMMWLPGSETNPVPPPSREPEQRLRGFYLSWHEDNGCLPGPALTNIFVSIEHCHEMYYGSVTQFWKGENVYEHEYQYYVDLLAVDNPWPEVKGGHYWLNIEGVFSDDFVPGYEGEGHSGWGWKIAEPGRPWDETNCPPAVYDRTGGTGWTSDPNALQPPHPRAGTPYDMAFELTTHEPGGAGPIVITNLLASGGSPTQTVYTVGTSGAGIQYLQLNTNLLTNVWTDIPGQTKALPFPAPWINTWVVTNAVETNRFYRVIER